MKKLSNRKAKQLSKPQITNGIKAAIKVKNILYTSGDEVRYKHYRNKICTLIRWSKRRYYDTFFENNMANMKKTWQGTLTLTLTEKNLKVISVKRILIIATKLLRMVRGYLTLLMDTLQQSETGLLTRCPFPKNII